MRTWIESEAAKSFMSALWVSSAARRSASSRPEPSACCWQISVKIVPTGAGISREISWKQPLSGCPERRARAHSSSASTSWRSKSVVRSTMRFCVISQKPNSTAATAIAAGARRALRK